MKILWKYFDNQICKYKISDLTLFWVSKNYCNYGQKFKNINKDLIIIFELLFYEKF